MTSMGDGKRRKAAGTARVGAVLRRRGWCEGMSRIVIGAVRLEGLPVRRKGGVSANANANKSVSATESANVNANANEKGSGS